ncbi:MAG: BatA domain-containing protein, partial [Clostridia bacterium]|nr:BatA domain-containing protein [Clostridia bacterium]
MSWLTPLGFLGFIGLIILLIIYLIKPNYQNKYISSTFVWKLSLKYRKKRIPLSKLRNILLIICQVLIIT